jgi:hypothetical protein
MSRPIGSRGVVRALAVAVVAALLVPVAAARPLVEKNGPAVSPTTARDWLRHPAKDKYYTESWTAMLRSSQGHIVFVTFLYSNIGVVSGRSGVNVSMTAPGKQAEHFSFEYATDDYSEDAATGAIEVGPNQVVLKDGNVTLKVDEADFRLSLKAKAWMPGVKAWDGRLWLKDNKSAYMDCWYHVPRADFEAEMVVGGKRVMLKGDLSLDHLAQNLLNTDLTTRWWTTRFFAPDHTILLYSFRFNKDNGGERMTRVIVTDRTKVLALATDVDLTTDTPQKDPKGHHYDTRYQLKLATPDLTLDATLTGKRVHDREAVMERLNWAQRGIASMIAGNPIIYRQEGDGEATLTLAGGAPVTLKAPIAMESIVNVDQP